MSSLYPLRDDLGRPVRLCRARDVRLDAPAEVRAAMRSVRRSRVMLVLVAGSAAVLVVTLIVRAASGMLTWDRGLALAFILPLVCFNYIALSTRQQQAAAALLRAGLCPACGYPLGGNLPEADGCCACPECGSAWRRFDQVK